MRREALTLIFAMFAGTLIMAACEKNPPQPKTVQSPPPVTSAAAVPPRPQPQVSSVDSKDVVPPVQGETDTKEPAQRQDFQQTR